MNNKKDLNNRKRSIKNKTNKRLTIVHWNSNSLRNKTEF